MAFLIVACLFLSGCRLGVNLRIGDGNIGGEFCLFVNMVYYFGKVAETSSLIFIVRAGVDAFSVGFIYLNNLMLAVNCDCAFVRWIFVVTLSPIIIGNVDAL